MSNVGSRESDLGQQIVRSTCGDLLEFDALMSVDGETGICDAEASGVGGVKAENF